MRGITRLWHRRGPAAIALWPVSQLYRAVTAIRRTAYARGWLRSVRLRVPVIVIGNLIAGGAGKTPTTLATIAILRSQGWVPGVVSRGYGRGGNDIRRVDAGSTANEVGDEPLLIHLRTKAPVFVGANRPAAARVLLATTPQVDIIVSDDGLQHLALRRDVEVLVFDERGAGNGWLLPAGPLREAVPRVVLPDQLVLYNAPSASTALPGVLARRELGGAVALADWWAGAAADLPTLHALRGRNVVAAAGLARPERYFTMLQEAGLTPTALPLPDHHDFATLPWPQDSTDVVVTEKDAVKLRPDSLATGGNTARVWVVTLDFAPEPAYASALARLLGPRRMSSAANGLPAGPESEKDMP